MYRLVIDRGDDRKVCFVDYTEQSLRAIQAANTIFPQAHPAILENHPLGQALDFLTLNSHVVLSQQ